MASPDLGLEMTPCLRKEDEHCPSGGCGLQGRVFKRKAPVSLSARQGLHAPFEWGGCLASLLGKHRENIYTRPGNTLSREKNEVPAQIEGEHR